MAKIGVSSLSPDLTSLLADLLHAKPKAGKRDTDLGVALAQLNERYVPEPFKSAAAKNPATAQQRADWYRTQAREARADEGGRAYTLASRTREEGPRKGQEFRTFVKRDDAGDVYRYHQYVTPSGKRKVFRVGGPMNRSLT